MTDPSETLTEPTLAVHPAEDVAVTDGVAEGDPVSFADVYQRDGGFIDYFHLALDDHQIIYAEGIAAEAC